MYSPPSNRKGKRDKRFIYFHHYNLGVCSLVIRFLKTVLVIRRLNCIEVYNGIYTRSKFSFDFTKWPVSLKFSTTFLTLLTYGKFRGSTSRCINYRETYLRLSVNYDDNSNNSFYCQVL